MNKVFEFFKSKNFRFSFIALIMAIGIFVIAFFVNFFAESFNKQWDVTSNKMYSISDTTDKILTDLKKDVEIIFLSDKDLIKNGGENGFLVSQFLDKYDKYQRVKVNYIDPDKNPDIITKLDKDNVLSLKIQNIVIKSEDKIKKVAVEDVFEMDQYGNVNFIGEQSITGAIKYVTSDIIPTVYFLEGHGEKSPDGEYSTIREILEANGYTTKKLNITIEGKVPEDCSILISAGPQKDLTPNESEKIISYMEGGGNSIFLVDPVNSNKKFTNFDNVFERYNIGLNYDRVKENNTSRHISGQPYDVALGIGYNELTAGIDPSQLSVILPESRSIKMLGIGDHPATVSQLFAASATAEGEAYGVEGENNKGPLDIALLSQISQAKDSKILVMGNAYFATDTALDLYPYAQNAVYLFLSAIGWMQNLSDEVMIMPKTPEMDSFNVTGYQSKVMMVVTIFMLPLLLLATGFIIWMRRRHL
jgi:hypothetical protein